MAGEAWGGENERIGDDTEVKRTQQKSPSSDTSKLEVTCETPGRDQKPERPCPQPAELAALGLLYTNAQNQREERVDFIVSLYLPPAFRRRLGSPDVGPYGGSR